MVCTTTTTTILSLLLLLLTPPSLANRHVINLPSSSARLRPSSLAYDPTAQHFLISSPLSTVSDAGVTSPLPLLPPASPNISALALDDSRRRLILALSHPPTVFSYDLRSPLPHPLLFSTALPHPPSALAVDPHTGAAFVTAGVSVFKVDADGLLTVLSQSPNFDGTPLHGVAHVRKGFLLAAQGSTGGVFKVDAEDGKARVVLTSGRPLAPGPFAAVAVAADGSAVVAGGAVVRMVKSDDAWAEAAVHDEVSVDEGWQLRGVAVREGRRAYVLVVPPEDEETEGGAVGRIEEVEWEREREGDMVWGMVLLGLGLAYFLYWRFQMGQLVGNMNKKRN